jgi:hypothetical protein
LAFLGLSTMTRFRPRTPPVDGAGDSPSARGAFAFEGLAAVEVLLDADRFLGEGVGAASGDDDFEDFRATVSSYLAPCKPLRSSTSGMRSGPSARSSDPVCGCSRYDS